MEEEFDYEHPLFKLGVFLVVVTAGPLLLALMAEISKLLKPIPRKDATLKKALVEAKKSE